MHSLATLRHGDQPMLLQRITDLEKQSSSKADPTAQLQQRDQTIAELQQQVAASQVALLSPCPSVQPCSAQIPSLSVHKCSHNVRKPLHRNLI